MKPRALLKQRKNYNTNSYELVSFYEDGTVTHKRYEHDDNNHGLFHEVDSKEYQVKGKIVLQKTTFDENNTRKNTELTKYTKELETFFEKDYKKAHESLIKLHVDSLDDLHVDYRLIFELDLDSITPDNPIPKEVTMYPITYFRATTNVKEIKRKKQPENLAIRLIPKINESLYFHYIPNNDHITMTGDNLFALDTRKVDKKLSEQEFVEYVNDMVKEVNEKAEYYHSLIVSQRNRRASLETNVMGDLFPR